MDNWEKIRKFEIQPFGSSAVFEVISFSYSSFFYAFLLLFFFFRSEGFSGKGCYIATSKSNSEETVCSCNHLTHFAVLVDYNVSLGVMILSFQLYHESIYVEFASRQYENNDII